MAKRSTGTRRRFDVFKRDGFICSYCGQSPPAVVLEVDHVIPIAEGGPDTIENLTTACFECNRGKAAVPLSVSPESLAARLEMMEEKRAQVRQYERLIRRERKRKEAVIDEVEEILLGEMEMQFTDRFRASVRAFLEKLPAPDVIAAAEKATRFPRANARIKYFCGICWRTIKGDGYAGA